MFDTIETPEDEWLEVEGMAHDFSVETYCDLLSGISAPVPIDTGIPHFGAQGTQWVVGETLFATSQLGTYAFSDSSQSRDDYGSMIGIERYLSGSTKGTSAGAPFDHGPGMFHVSDHQTRTTGFYLNLRCEEIYFPKALFGYEPNDSTPESSFSYDTLIGKMVLAEWEDVFSALKKGDRALSAAKVDRLMACLKIAMGAHPQREDVRAQAREALFQQICRHIDARLSLENVTTNSLLRDFGVSRAGLYRMFEPHGGVRTYITQRRTFRALLDIAKTFNKRGAVQAAADRWGFSSGPNFNRAVKRLFGASPGALFSSPTRQRTATNQGSMLIEKYMAAVAAA